MLWGYRQYDPRRRPLRFTQQARLKRVTKTHSNLAYIGQTLASWAEPILRKEMLYPLLHRVTSSRKALGTARGAVELITHRHASSGYFLRGEVRDLAGVVLPKNNRIPVTQFVQSIALI